MVYPSRQEFVKIKEYLSLLDLENVRNLNGDVLKSNYRKAVLKYHPDVCDPAYKDGQAFVKVKEAHDWLILHIDIANQLLNQTIQSKEPVFRRKKRRSEKPLTQEYNAAIYVNYRHYPLERIRWERPPLGSNNIKYIWYDSKDCNLYILFFSPLNTIYCYENVDWTEYISFRDSESVGKYLWRNIIPQYRCVKMNPPESYFNDL